MRVLTVVGKHYYGLPGAIEPAFLEFTEPLVELGHHVDHLDPAPLTRAESVSRAGEAFVAQAKTGRYDVILFLTAFHKAELVGEYVREAARFTPVVAWNTDDDWAWESQTRALAPYFTHMVTTYRHVYEENRLAHPNLLLSQWACQPRYGRFDQPKDLDFTFAGQLYGDRVASCRVLARSAGLQVYGYLSGRVRYPAPLFWRGVRRITSRFPSVYGAAISFDTITDIWNRSKVSFTPMEASVDTRVLQIKSRTFQMGLSGTVMICRKSRGLEEFYEPDREFATYESLEECADKVRHFLHNESDRRRMATAYRDRTLRDHLWTHRFRKLFAEIGIGSSTNAFVHP